MTSVTRMIETSKTYEITKKIIFADRDCAKCRIFVACSCLSLPRDSFAVRLNLLVKSHPLLCSNTTSIFVDPNKTICIYCSFT